MKKIIVYWVGHMSKLILTILFSAILLSSIVSFPPAHSIPTDEIAKLLASDPADNDEFGTSVSISGDTAVVGAPQPDDFETGNGAAYVFEKVAGTWTQVAKLTASDGADDDQFGISVSISGDTVIVGAFQDDEGGPFSGAAYIFVKPGSGWVDTTQDAKLTASDAASGKRFGFSVSISGDTAIVGGGGTLNTVYVFVKPGGGWTGSLNEDAKLTGSDSVIGDDFGFSISISGDTAIAGAWNDDDAGSSSGSAYVFVKPGGGWTGSLNEDAKLTASDAVTADFFGFSVSISGDTAIVGASGDDDAGESSGSAYIFVKPGGGWTGSLNEDAKLTASDAASVDQFGESVSISGDTAIVGVRFDGPGGSAYVFVKPGGGWAGSLNEDAKLTASDAASGDGFGKSVSISGDTVIVGAFRSNDGGNDTGSAYIFGPMILIGGTLLPIDSTSLILAGAQMTAAWMIPVIIAGIGIAIVIARKF